MDTEDDPGPAVGLTGARFGGAPRRRRAARLRAEAPAANAPDGGPGADGRVAPGTDPAPPSGASPTGLPPADPVVGRTGARFGGVRRREAPAPPADGPTQQEPVPGRGSTATPAREEPRPRPTAATTGPGLRDGDAAGPEEQEVGGSAFVRPYVFTGGRTRPSMELSIETLVSVAPRPPSARLTGEHEVLLGLCREPRSVAELAARAGVPLGVARVLVGDLAAAGAVAVHRSAGAAGPDLALMQRVLSGLRRL